MNVVMIMTKKVVSVTQSKGREISLEEIVMTRLKELFQPLDNPSKLVRFPTVFGKICPVLCLKKDEAWAILQHLQTRRLIEIIPYQGIKILEPPPMLIRDSSLRSSNDSTVAKVQHAKQRVLDYLKERKQAYPSDIAEALDLDIDMVFVAAKKLLREGRIEV